MIEGYNSVPKMFMLAISDGNKSVGSCTILCPPQMSEDTILLPLEMPLKFRHSIVVNHVEIRLSIDISFEKVRPNKPPHRSIQTVSFSRLMFVSKLKLGGFPAGAYSMTL